MTWLARYVQFWDRREGAQALALVRILVGLVILSDLLQVQCLGLTVALFGPKEAGGIGTGMLTPPSILFYDWFGHTAFAAQALLILSMLCAASLTLGLYSRISALALLLCYAQIAKVSPGADRGIDVLLRNSLLVIACSGAGATWSVDAYRRHRRLAVDAVITAWPRYMLIAQLVLLYFWAGIQKQSAAWTGLGGYSALFIVLNEPHYARLSLSHGLLSALYPILQASTIVTLIFERGAVFVPIVMWLRATRDRGGVLRALVTRGHVFEVWVATGAFFHVGLALVTQLGIFPWGCLALYPAFASPERIAALAQRIVERVVRARSTRWARQPTS